MERKVILYWIAQFVGWSAYYGFSALLLISSEIFFPTFNLGLSLFTWMLFSVAVSHGMRWVIIRGDILSKKIHLLIIYTLILSFISAALLETFQHFMTFCIPQDFFPLEEGWSTEFNFSEFLLAILRSVILFLLWSGSYYVFVIIEKSRKQEMLNLQWEASKNEIELKNLRAQLNPHFLFNSLNSIRALVGLNPDQAKEAITQLSFLLRSSINLGKQKLVPLRDELELVKNYLQLEQMRFEERLNVKLNVSDSALGCEIPPLMLQTIVENAIKHGISKTVSGGDIIIIGNKEQNKLELIINNTGKLADQNPAENGVGLVNSRKRLKLLFGDKANLDISQQGDLVSVKINISYP